MIEHIIVVLLFVGVIAQRVYIFQTRRQQKEWLSVLKNIKQGKHEKVFVRGDDTISDIGFELNRIIEEHQLKISQLQKAEKANQQVLTSLSHDVRTPLASLLGYLEALNNGVVSGKEETQYLGVAYRKAGDLKVFVDMLFEWCKLNSNEQTFHFEAVEIDELTKEIIIEWIPVFEKHGISLQADIPDSDLMVKLDKMAYTRILNNLFQNAVNHGEGDRISIGIHNGEKGTYVEVGNNGTSIAEDKLPYIFDRLYKCDDARSGKGSGLGLAITKELVLAMHGTITARSSQNGDTVFAILFHPEK